MSLTAAEIAADYAEAFNRRAPKTTVKIRRYSGAVPARTASDTTCLAIVRGYKAAELVGTIVQGDRHAVVLVNDAVSAILPILVTDKLVVRGKELAIKSVDDSTRRDGDTLIAIELQVGG